MPANCSSSVPWIPCAKFCPLYRPRQKLRMGGLRQAALCGPEQVLDYVGRYTHRVALSNNRLLDIENGQVRFQRKDYREDGQTKTMTLSADEFIRRFLLHVLPNGFPRDRKSV